MCFSRITGAWGKKEQWRDAQVLIIDEVLSLFVATFFLSFTLQTIDLSIIYLLYL